MGQGVEPDPRSWAVAAHGTWQRDVDRVRDPVGEVVELERALVRDDRRARQVEPGDDDVLVRPGRGAREAEARALGLVRGCEPPLQLLKARLDSP